MGILIVDDSKIERMILKELFELEGHTVDVSENGEEALQSAFVSLPDLIVSDILMPVMDGFSLCKSIRSDARTAHIPFVFYTATYTKDEDEALGIKVGADGFFRKSMEWDEFYAAATALVRNIKTSGRIPKGLPDPEEVDIYKLYNERLIKKLEDKVFELEKEVRWRKKIEIQLRESKQHLDLAIEGADIGMWSWDIVSGDVCYTKKWAENLGYHPDEIPLRYSSWEKLVHPDDRDKTFSALKDNLSGRTQSYESEHRLRDASGNWLWVLARGKVMARDAQGNPLRHAGTFIEVTERKHAEESLRKSREELRALSQHLQSAIENERSKIARDIHDELGQILAAIKFDVVWLKNQIPEDRKKTFKRAETAISLIDNAVKSVRRIVSDLRPGLLDDLGLVAAIEWQAGEYEKLTGVKHSVVMEHENISANSDLSTAVFRVCQEAMTNAALHAKANHVLVRGNIKNDILELLVMDNGIGIDDDKIFDSRSFGLMGMRERIGSFGGSLDISRGANGGTRIAVKIPVN